jgi:hypothetical protein
MTQVFGTHRVERPREETRGRLEDLDSSLQLAVLALKLPDLPGRLAADPGRLALVYLGLADPLAQRLCRHPQPPCHRGDRRILRRIITSVLAHQPDRLGLGLLVVLDRHERDILPNFGSMHETRDGSHSAPLGLCARAGTPPALAQASKDPREGPRGKSQPGGQ